jgi:phage-related protein
MNRYKAIFYTDNRGKELVREFIDAQDSATRTKFVKLLELLQVYGPELMMPYARYLRGGIYELRIRGKNEVRVFYLCITKQHSVVLLHAFKKRTQKMPAKEFAVAQKRQKELTTL